MGSIPGSARWPEQLAAAFLAALALSLVPLTAGAAAATTPAATPAATPAIGAGAQASSIAWGVYEPGSPASVAPLQDLESKAGRHAAIVMWYEHWAGQWSGFNATDYQTVFAHGSIPMITWMSDDPAQPSAGAGQAAYAPARIAAGDFDPYIRSWAAGLASLHQPVLMRLDHEMNGNWYAWSPGVNGNTAADYVAMWKHVRAIFQSAGASNVLWVWSPNIDFGGAAPIAPLFPGEDQVDWVAMDGYNWGPTDQWHSWKSLTETLAPTYQTLTGLTSKPLMVAETGCAEGTAPGQDKASWITSGLGTELAASFPRIQALVWFDQPDGVDFRIRSSAPAQAAFASAIQGSNFSGTWATPAPPQAPPPAPAPQPKPPVKAPPQPVAGAPAPFHSLAPVRILDTRPETQVGPFSTPLGSGEARSLAVAGQGPVPAAATAVMVNVTVTGTSASSYLSLFPTGGQVPTVSSLNWTVGQTVSNLVELPVGTGGAISVYNLDGKADVVMDVAGYVAPDPGPAGLYNPLPPARILDTRGASGAIGPYASPFGSGETRRVQVAGLGGVPAGGAVAAVLNVTVTGPSSAGYLTAYPAGSTRPAASNLNWSSGQTVANRVTVQLGSGGYIEVYNQAGQADVIIDVAGWYTDAQSTAGGRPFTSITPNRILDTRAATQVGPSGGALAPGESRLIPVAGRGGVPATGAGAVVLNVTATNTGSGGFLTVFPADLGTVPGASDLNWSTGQSVPNMVVVRLDANGNLRAFNPFGSVDLVMDVVGYY